MKLEATVAGNDLTHWVCCRTGKHEVQGVAVTEPSPWVEAFVQSVVEGKVDHRTIQTEFDHSDLPKLASFFDEEFLQKSCAFPERRVAAMRGPRDGYDGKASLQQSSVTLWRPLAQATLTQPPQAPPSTQLLPPVTPTTPASTSPGTPLDALRSAVAALQELLGSDAAHKWPCDARMTSMIQTTGALISQRISAMDGTLASMVDDVSSTLVSSSKTSSASLAPSPSVMENEVCVFGLC